MEAVVHARDVHISVRVLGCMAQRACLNTKVFAPSGTGSYFFTSSLGGATCTNAEVFVLSGTEFALVFSV